MTLSVDPMSYLVRDVDVKFGIDRIINSIVTDSTSVDQYFFSPS